MLGTLLAFVVEGLAYSAAAAYVRRRFESKGLVMLAVAGGLVLATAVPFIEPFATEFRDGARQPAFGSMLGVVASSLVIHRFAKRAAPSPQKAIAWGTVAFSGAFFFGVGFAGLTLFAMG